MPDTLLYVMDLIGTIAFALSGSMVAIRKRMDIFGVTILGIVTAVGGGIFRDILVGNLPPLTFREPFFILIAFITSNIAFCVLFFHKKRYPGQLVHLYGEALFWLDTMGLAAFTVDGVAIGLHLGADYGFFFPVFLGVMTGVGGGALRDVFSMEMPAIFVKRVYAVASLLGACVICFSIRVLEINESAATIAGFQAVILIRFLARQYDWNLPRIE